MSIYLSVEHRNRENYDHHLYLQQWHDNCQTANSLVLFLLSLTELLTVIISVFNREWLDHFTLKLAPCSRWKVTLFLLIYKDCVGSVILFVLIWFRQQCCYMWKVMWIQNVSLLSPIYSSIVCWISELASCWCILFCRGLRCSLILAVRYRLVIIKVNHNLVSWRAKGCKRFPLRCKALSLS